MKCMRIVLCLIMVVGCRSAVERGDAFVGRGELLKAESVYAHEIEEGSDDGDSAYRMAVMLLSREDGTRVWRLRTGSPGAQSLNLGFSRYNLPAGARLHVYSSDFKHSIRPFTAKDNAAHAAGLFCWPGSAQLSE